jgi:NAD(P)-dependent dehydrogenase (short-subunit alcohol dehydrogenase family)
MDINKLMFRQDLLAGQNILVTGGGTGLGKEFATAFVSLGADVVICGRRPSVLEEAAQDIEAVGGGRVRIAVCNIADSASVEQMVADIWREKPLTGLVNNAAGNFISRTQDLSMRAFDSIANIVCRGTFNVTLEIGKRWIDSSQCGNVLSILATWVWNGSPYTVPSAMSKTAIHAMTQSLAVEWGHYGIRLNAIAPGKFPTQGAWKRLWPGDEGNAPDDAADNPMGRVGEMHEIANLAVFLLSPGAEYLTGQTIAIDGGAFQATGANFSALRSWSDDEWRAAREAIGAANERDKALRATAKIG